MARGRRRKGTRRIALSPNARFRLLFVVPFALVAGLLCFSVSGANILRPVRPDLAMSFQPFDARARARAAEQRLSTLPISRAQLAEAERLALEALRRDPTIVVAWRTLGIVATARNEEARATRLFRFSGYLSKRDLPTQMWLIEDRVRANDIEGALRHYDAALRAKPDSAAALLPILVAATANDGIVPPLARLLNTNPPWRRPFLTALASNAPDAENFARFVELVIRGAPIEERNIVATRMAALIEQRQYGPALHVYRLLAGGDGRAQLVRNGSFEQPNPYPPLDWLLNDQPDFRAEQQAAVPGGAGGRLQISASNGAGGVAARQMLLLSPGNYEIRATAGAVEEVRPARLGWSVQCNNPQGTVLLEQDLPQLSARIAPAARFRVPPGGCEGQWLSLKLRGDFDPGGVAAWIDLLSIRPI
ncbi:MAG TPA: hypothetical protein VEC11_06420 [Allosphingosinicella sp.]|nr:hypothetical protein [Allosphingosinicella sp.]